MAYRLPLFALLVLLPACGPTPPPPASLPVRTMSASFDLARTGTVNGVLRWRGAIPDVPPLRSTEEPLLLTPGAVHDWPNPNAPRIDAATQGVGSAVVFLRGVDPDKARPWHHPDAVVEVRDQHFHINTPFVRAGDAVTFVSHETRLHTVQARGAAFVALALPQVDRPRSRRLSAPGVVELLSGTGYHWMRAYLHVAEHPYYTRPDGKGAFRLDQVPAGEYDVVAWHPSWLIAANERNPDLGRVQQVRFAAALEVVARVKVEVGQVADVEMALEASK